MRVFLSVLYRFARVAVAQLIGLLIVQYGNISIPYFGVTVGAGVTALFKFLREKYPTSPLLLWLPL